jgi:hypothetical protein
MNIFRCILALSVVITLAIALSSGCNCRKDDPGNGSGTVTSTMTSPTGTGINTAPTYPDTGDVGLSSLFTRVFDPKLDGDPRADFSFKVNHNGQHTASVVVFKGRTEIKTILNNQSVQGNTPVDAYWDGKDKQGKFVDTGEYTVQFNINGSFGQYSQDFSVHVVRLGVDRLSFESADEGAEYPLMFNRTSSSNLSDVPIGSQTAGNFEQDVVWKIASLDQPDGLPTPEDPPWGNQEGNTGGGASALAELNWPCCYRMASRVQMKVHTGNQAVSNMSSSSMPVGYPVSGFPILITALFRGYTFAGGASPDASNISPDGVYTLTCNGLTEASVGAGIESIDIYFFFHDGQGWVLIPGCQETTHMMYRIADAPTAGALAQDPNAGSARMYAEALRWSCEWCEAEGVTHKSQVLGAVYKHCWNFGDPRYTYEHNQTEGGNPAGFTVRYMLDHHSCRCGGWSYFFLCLVGCQGEFIQGCAIFCNNEQYSGYANGTQVSDAGVGVRVFTNIAGQNNVYPSLANEFADHALNVHDRGVRRILPRTGAGLSGLPGLHGRTRCINRRHVFRE